MENAFFFLNSKKKKSLGYGPAEATTEIECSKGSDIIATRTLTDGQISISWALQSEESYSYFWSISSTIMSTWVLFTRWCQVWTCANRLAADWLLIWSHDLSWSQQDKSARKDYVNGCLHLSKTFVLSLSVTLMFEWNQLLPNGL